MDTVSGKRAGEGLAAIPSKDKAIMELKTIPLQPYPEERLEREKIIFRSYDMMKMNIIRDCS
jgi:cyanate lyase